MSLQHIACRVSDALTRVNRHPVTCLLFVPGCALVVTLGHLAGQLELTLLALTTVLSVDASWTNRLTMLKLGQDAGEVETK